HRVLTDAQRLGYGPAGKAAGREAQHLHLTLREADRPGMGHRRRGTLAEVLTDGVHDLGVEDGACLCGEDVQRLGQRDAGGSRYLVRELIEAVGDGNDPGAEWDVSAAAAAEVAAAVDVLVVIA